MLDCVHCSSTTASFQEHATIAALDAPCSPAQLKSDKSDPAKQSCSHHPTFASATHDQASAGVAQACAVAGEVVLAVHHIRFHHGCAARLSSSFVMLAKLSASFTKSSILASSPCSRSPRACSLSMLSRMT